MANTEGWNEKLARHRGTDSLLAGRFLRNARYIGLAELEAGCPHLVEVEVIKRYNDEGVGDSSVGDGDLHIG